MKAALLALSLSLSACVAEVGRIAPGDDATVSGPTDAQELHRDLGPISDAEPDAGRPIFGGPDAMMPPPRPDGSMPPPPMDAGMMPPPRPDGSMPPPPMDGGNTGSCNPACTSPDVCCTQGMCAGRCVPDCRLGGMCPMGLTCDQGSGVCLP